MKTSTRWRVHPLCPARIFELLVVAIVWVSVAAVVAFSVTAVVAFSVTAGAAAKLVPGLSQGGADLAATRSGALFADAVVNLAAGHSYPGYDNDIFEDCVAATVGDLLITSFDTTPSTSDITGAFFYAGGTSTEGLSWQQLVNYWSSSRIDGTTLESWSAVKGNNIKSQVERWLHYGGTVGSHNAQRAVIDIVDLPRNAVADRGGVSSGSHMWLIVGYTPRDALVVSWGSEFAVRWPKLLAWSAARAGGGGFKVVAVSR